MFPGYGTLLLHYLIPAVIDPFVRKALILLFVLFGCFSLCSCGNIKIVFVVMALVSCSFGGSAFFYVHTHILWAGFGVFTGLCCYDVFGQVFLPWL